MPPFITNLYFVCILLCFISSIAALPCSRFPHDTQTLNYPHARRAPFKESRTSHLLRRIESRSTRLQRRGLPGAVYICTDQNFRGDCSWIAPNSECHITGTGEFAPESIGPDPDGHCILYEKATCTGNEVETLRYPGRATNMPAFMGLKCFSDGREATGNSSGFALNSTSVANTKLSDADPRLMGGFGSLDAKRLSGVLSAMAKDGFREGMIGLKKGHYY